MSRKWHAIGLQVALFDPPYPILQPRALLSPARGFIFLQSLSTKNGRNCATLWIQKCGCARARARESSHWVPLHPISHALVLLRPQCSRFPLRMNDPSRRVGPARGLVAGIAGCAMPPFVARVGPISHLAQITGGSLSSIRAIRAVGPSLLPFTMGLRFGQKPVQISRFALLSPLRSVSRVSIPSAQRFCRF